MSKLVMKKSVCDNEYLHKDFHSAFSYAVEYLDKNYGEDAVREYLRYFAKAFYAPLTLELKEKGLVAIKKHFEMRRNAIPSKAGGI